MKYTEKNQDPLDRKIDELLSEQAIEPSPDFISRTNRELDRQTKPEQRHGLAPLIRFALPIAAAVALAMTVYYKISPKEAEALAQAKESEVETNNDLNIFEIQEIFLLQEGLSGFAQLETEELSSSDKLLNTLQTLHSI